MEIGGSKQFFFKNYAYCIFLSVINRIFNVIIECNCFFFNYFYLTVISIFSVDTNKVYKSILFIMCNSTRV